MLRLSLESSCTVTAGGADQIQYMTTAVGGMWNYCSTSKNSLADLQSVSPM